jgi:hypothetical protein
MMSFDQICVTGTGVSFTGLGFIMRKQQKKNWQAFLFGGIMMLAIVVLSLIFGWPL